jgi:hypothetical protein
MNFPKIYRRFAFVAVGVLLVGLFPAAAMAQAGEKFTFEFTVPDADPVVSVLDVVAGNPLNVVVTAHVGDSSDTDLDYHGTVTFTSNDSYATISDPCVFAAGVCDSASVTFETAGARHLTATDGDANTSDSDPVTVNHAVVKTLQLNPADTDPIIAGGTKAYTAIAYDAFSNQWDATGEMSLSIDDGGVTGSCTNTADTHTCTSTKAVSHTVTATDGPAIPGTSTLNVNPEVLAKLVLTPAGGDHAMTVDGSKAYTVQGADSYDNLIPGDLTGSTSLSIDPDGTCNNGDHTCTATVSGTHTVTGAGSGKTGTSTLYVNPGDLDHLDLTPTAGDTTTAGIGKAYTVHSADSHDNLISDVTGSTTLSISPDDGSCSSDTCTATVAIDHIVTGTYSGKTGSSTLHVSPGALAKLVLTPTGGGTILAGETKAYTVQGADSYDNLRAGYLTGSTTLSISPDDGTCNNGDHTCTATVSGDHIVTGTDTNDTSKTGTSTLHVNPGDLDHLDLTPTAGDTTTAGIGKAYTVHSADSHDNLISDVTGSTTLSISPDDGSCSSDTCTATVAIDHIVTGTYSGKTGSSTLHVSPGALAKLVLTPTGGGTILAGETKAYTVQGADAHNNLIDGDLTGSTTLSISPDGLCDNGAHTCTATVSGPHTVTGNDDGKSGTAILNVNPGDLAKLVLSPDGASIQAGDVQHYTVQGADAHNNLIAGDLTGSTALSITGTGNTCDNTAHTCTGTMPGLDYMVTGTYNDDHAITGTALLTIAHGGLSYLVLSPDSTTITADHSQAYTVEGFDASHNLIPGDQTSFTELTIDGTGVCENVTAKSCTSTKPGTFKVTGTIGSAHGSATLIVAVGAATHFDVTSFPGGLAPISGSVDVTALDQWNNTVTNYTGTVKITSSDGGAVKPANSILPNGVGTFAVTLITAGSQTITATDTVGTSITGHSVAIAVTRVASEYHGLALPMRLLDSRTGNGLADYKPKKLVANATVAIQIAGRGGVDEHAVAVTVNAAITNASAASTLYLGPGRPPVMPAGVPTPFTIAFNRADTTDFGVTVGLDGNGKVSATYQASSGTTDLVLDVTGYFAPDTTGSTYFPLANPVRLLDSRIGNGLSGKFKANVPRSFKVAGRSGSGVPANAKAVTGSLTVTNANWSWAVYLGPGPMPAGLPSSTLNFAKGQTRNNAVTVPLSSTGYLSATFLSSKGKTCDLVFDVSGYYLPGATGAKYVPITPAPILDSRNGTGHAGKFFAKTAHSFQATNVAGIPLNATAMAGVVSVKNQTSTWAVYVGSTDLNNPGTSSLNFLKSDNCSNGLTVGFSNAGTMSATYMGPPGNNADIVIYVNGYFVPPTP